MSRVYVSKHRLPLLLCCQVLVMLTSVLPFKVTAGSLVDGAIQIESLDEELMCMSTQICLVSGTHIPSSSHVPQADLDRGLIQLTEEPTSDQRNQLANHGVSLIYALPNHAWYATFNDDPSSTLDLTFVNWIGELQWEDKISYALSQSESERMLITVHVWPNNDTVWMGMFGEPTTLAEDIYLMDVAAADINTIALRDEVMWIDLSSAPDTPEAIVESEAIVVNPINTNNPLYILVGGEWVLSTVNENPVAIGETVTIRFDGKDAKGFGGCNNYDSTYILDSDQISLDDFIASLGMCENTSDFEFAYFEALDTVTTWRIENNVLILENDDGSIVLTYSTTIRSVPTAVQIGSLSSNINQPMPWIITLFISLFIPIVTPSKRKYLT